MAEQNAGTVTGPPPEVLAALWRLCPEVGRDITEHWHAPLSSYARHLWRPTSAPTSRLGATARSILRETLQDRLAAHMPPESLKAALGEFDRRSVIQTGLHCQLLLDRMTFDAFLLGWLGAVENSLSTFLVFTGTTMTMETIGRKVPARSISVSTRSICLGWDVTNCRARASAQRALCPSTSGRSRQPVQPMPPAGLAS